MIVSRLQASTLVQTSLHSKTAILFHPSPTRHSDYIVTGQWRCNHCWQLPASAEGENTVGQLWISMWLAVNNSDYTVTVLYCVVTVCLVGYWWNRSFAVYFSSHQNSDLLLFYIDVGRGLMTRWIRSKGIFSDSNSHFLWHESVDINKKKLISKNSADFNFVLASCAWFHCSTKYFVALIIIGDNYCKILQ